MKLIIQIPCYNEEKNLEKVIKSLPTQIEGIEKIEYMVINDGSTDKTREIAIKNNVNYLVDVYPNKGLANTFTTGIDECLKNGADIIVNIDGDNQYPGYEIPRLVKPIVENRADMVIGERQIEKFSPIKRILQRIGSKMVRIVSKTKVPDAPSGFRAYSRECALKLNVYNKFTYTLETLVQAGANKTKIETIKIESFPNTRKSRLFKNIPQYIYKSSANIIKALFIYKPIKMWAIASFVSLVCSILSFIKMGTKAILPYIFIIIAVQFAIASMQSIAVQANRNNLEKIQYFVKKERYEKNEK